LLAPICGGRTSPDDIVKALLAAPDDEPEPPDNPMSADRIRWEHIQRVYELCGHNVSETARRLNMHRAHAATDVQAPVFDFWGGMYGMLLAGLNLREGASGAIPAIAEYQDGERPAAYRVLGQDDVMAGSHGRKRAWQVAAGQPDDLLMTFSLIQTPPYVLKLVYTDRATGRIWTWDMFERT